MNRKFNRKFYAPPGWPQADLGPLVFPILNTDASLRVIDRALQQYLRYLVTGRHNRQPPRERHTTCSRRADTGRSCLRTTRIAARDWKRSMRHILKMIAKLGRIKTPIANNRPQPAKTVG